MSRKPGAPRFLSIAGGSDARSAPCATLPGNSSPRTESLKPHVPAADTRIVVYKGTHEVLVIEDSAVIQRLIEVCLRPEGVTIVSRADGTSGLSAARQLSPDLVILDVGLPGLSGWEVLDELRTDPTTRDMKILILTAHSRADIEGHADIFKADAFLSKPFGPQELRAVVRQLLDAPSPPNTGDSTAT